MSTIFVFTLYIFFFFVGFSFLGVRIYRIKKFRVYIKYFKQKFKKSKALLKILKNLFAFYFVAECNNFKTVFKVLLYLNNNCMFLIVTFFWILFISVELLLLLFEMANTFMYVFVGLFALLPNFITV